MDSRNLRSRRAIAVLAALAVLGACEQAFTTSPFSRLERDPENMSKQQLIRYAEDALRSGSQSAARKAYEALSGKVDDDDGAELNFLLADLAMSASGFSEVVPDLLKLAFDGELREPAALTERLGGKLGNLRYRYVVAAAEQMEAAHAKGAAANEQAYLEIGLGLVMRAANEAGDFDAGGWTNDAETFGLAAKDFVEDAAQNRLEDPKYIGGLVDLLAPL